MNRLEEIRGQLIVSCQALADEPLHSAFIMSKMARAAAEGGAGGIRANGIQDIKAIKEEVSLPLIGIIKVDHEESPVRITPTLIEVEALVRAGVEIIAFDATDRPRPDGSSIQAFFGSLKERFPDQLFMADVSTVEEAILAEKLGADLVATTLVGYTDYTIGHDPITVLERMVAAVNIPVIAEGNIDTPDKAHEALLLGAHAVVVGSAITRPQLITKQFIHKMREHRIT